MFVLLFALCESDLAFLIACHNSQSTDILLMGKATEVEVERALAHANTFNHYFGHKHYTLLSGELIDLT
jgi:hypothetical protein